MLMYLLKSALPFTLTFVVGAALGGFLYNPFGARREVSRIMRTELHDYSSGRGRACKQRRFKRRELVAETKPLVILNVPGADFKGSEAAERVYSHAVSVEVTFGADGKVQKVEPLGSWRVHGREKLAQTVWEAIERAARQIQFEPGMINGVLVSVTKEVEIPLVQCHFPECFQR